MISVTDVFYAKLSGDESIVQSLSRFNNRPAIFTYEPVPKGVEGNYIITVGAVADDENDTKTSIGRRILRDIRCYSPATGSALIVESIAERVRSLFHGGNVSITGFKVIDISVSGPRVLDERDYYGRVLSVNLLLSGTS